MINVLFVGPDVYSTVGNGGILSWSKKFVKNFPNEEFQIIHAANSYRRCKSTNASIISRIIDGLLDLCFAYKNAKRALKQNDIKLFHTVTSGSLGTLRDLCLIKLCHRHGIKGIMHCRYGCITEDINSKGLIGCLLRKTMSEYDQIWVLDSRSYNTLNNNPKYAGKIYLTPNSIQIKEPQDLLLKQYNKVAFIGNLISTKGIYELTEAVARTENVHLDIVGAGEDEVVNHIKELAGQKLGSQIVLHGRLENDLAVKFMKSVDIVALPTYYPSEGFPISILEAMSLSKMVISCPRAAIKDMLTDVDGNPCGILVKEKSVDEIEQALHWCQDNKVVADKMCAKAYEKVYTSYRQEVIYELYRNCYRKLLI